MFIPSRGLKAGPPSPSLSTQQKQARKNSQKGDTHAALLVDAAAAPATGTPPKPNLLTPIPNLSISCELPPGFAAALLAVAAVAAFLFKLNAAAFFASSCLIFSSSSSRCRSYPSCLILSASSLAFRSASSKSKGAAAFLAPRPPSFPFRAAAPVVVVADGVVDVEVVLEAVEERRDAPNFAGLDEPKPPVEDVERNEEEVTVRGPVVAEDAEVDRDPMTGGGAGEAGLEEVGVEGLEAGLSHEEKKSSSAFSPPPLAGVAEVDLEVSTPSTEMPYGNLFIHTSH